MPPRFLCEVISIFSIKIWYCKICKKCYQITNIQKINLFFGCFLKTIGASNWCEKQKKTKIKLMIEEMEEVDGRTNQTIFMITGNFLLFVHVCFDILIQRIDVYI